MDKIKLAVPLQELNPQYFAPVQVNSISKLCCCCSYPSNVPVLNAFMVILNYDVWAFIGWNVIVGVLTMLSRKEGYGLPFLVFNICIGTLALCYRSRIQRWLAGGAHQTGTVDIFSIRRNIHGWHNFFFLYSAWNVVIYIFYFLWTIVEIGNPLKNSKDKESRDWSKDLPDQKVSVF